MKKEDGLTCNDCLNRLKLGLPSKCTYQLLYERSVSIYD